METLMTRKYGIPSRVLAVATVLTAALTVTGCSVGEVVRQQAGIAACSLITPVIDQMTKDVQAAIDTSGIDPAQALVNLNAARTMLRAINRQITKGGQNGAVQAALDTLDKLIPLVEAAANGNAAEQPAIDKLQVQLSKDVAALTKAC